MIRMREVFVLLNYQRIDRFYLRDKENKLSECTEDDALKLVTNKLSTLNSSKIASLVGNSLDCETVFSFKLLLDKLNINNYDCRQDNSYFIPGKRSSYIFNSTISGIDDSDLCFLIGTDIKKEAPILSSRI